MTKLGSTTINDPFAAPGAVDLPPPASQGH